MRQDAHSGLWLIVPVKPFGQGKSRLASQLSPTERAVVSRQMLIHLLEVAAASRVLAGVLVVSRDPNVLALAAEVGAIPVEEVGEGINAALDQATSIAAERGAQAILVLPGDLPLITRQDIAQLEQSLPNPAGICLAESKDGGTNALAMRPIGAIPFAFGAKSFARHRSLADVAGLPIYVINSPTLAVDLDSPADLWVMNQK